MEKAPHVSIGMPVYNGEQFMANALESILQQTYTDFEVIIADNASTDNTEAIARGFADRDKRVRYVRNEQNIGANPNFNLLFELAKGDYFKWAAYDDTLAPEYLEKCVKVLDEDPSFVMCHSKTQRISAEGKITPSPDPPRRLDSVHVAERFHDLVLETHHINEVYALTRSEALRRTNLNQPFYGSDKMLLAELLVQGRCYEVPEYLFTRGAHLAKMTKRTTRKLRERWAASKSKGTLVEFQFLRGYWRALWSVPMRWQDRVACLRVLLTYVFGWTPWKRRLQRKLRQTRMA